MTTIDAAAPADRRPLAVVRAAAGDIKLAHTVFAMPFAVLAAWRAAPRSASGAIDWPAFVGPLALVLVCMVAARTWAMLVNRLADHRIDARNPRTSRRAIPAGRMSVRAGLVLALASAGVFVACCAGFWVFFANPWPLALSAPVLAWIALYSFMKRFTALCHVFLGSALAISPLAAALAVQPGALSEASLWLLSAMILCWVAGFDVIYALADLEFDRREGVHSAPALLGWRGANHAARALHALAAVALVAMWWVDPQLGVIFAIAAAAGVGLLMTEHAILAKRGPAGLSIAFFTINGLMSVLLGLAGVADLWVIRP